MFNQLKMFLLLFLLPLAFCSELTQKLRCDELASSCLLTINHGKCLRQEYFSLPSACLEHVAHCNDPAFLDQPILERVFNGATYRIKKVVNPLSSSFRALGFARGLYFGARAVLDMRKDLAKDVSAKLCCPIKDGVKVCYPNKGPNVLKHGSSYPCSLPLL